MLLAGTARRGSETFARKDSTDYAPACSRLSSGRRPVAKGAREGAQWDLADGAQGGSRTLTVELCNDRLRVRLSDAGLLVSIQDLVTGVVRALAHDSWTMTIGGRVLSYGDASLMESAADLGGHRFLYAVGGHLVDLHYALPSATGFLRRSIRLRPVVDAVSVTHVGYGPLVFAANPSEAVPYDTFRDCPTVTFLRWDDGGGMYLGIQEPAFETSLDDAADRMAIAQGYAPGLMLSAGEGHDADAQFIGVTRLTGELVTRGTAQVTGDGRRALASRPLPRPDGPRAHRPRRDRAPCARSWRTTSHPLPERFRSILYTYWFPLPQPPLDEAGVTRWIHAIDTFADLGGDLLMTTPLVRSSLPDASQDGFWDVAPDGSGAARVLHHARSRGVGVGLYMGVAAGNLEHGNAAALDYPAGAPDAWKKVDEDGTVSGENCMASDAYLDWSVAVQANTIERFGLAGWSWNPGPGNGRFCFATGHGHLPGQGSPSRLA